ncbi:MAG TPA: hypothetical protein VMS21_03725 [Methylomirabilota bacterium]|nr:hypothetical protein [Methylomirabilota bacterium]
MARWGYYPKRSEFVYNGRSRLRIRKEYQYTGSTWQWIGDTRYVYDGMRVIQERDSSNIPTVSYSV